MTAAAEALCTECARCCNGRMFRATTLEPQEEQRFGCRALPQPCPFLTEKRCGIYATRPKACSSFYCEVALQLQRGDIDLPEARRRVEKLPQLNLPPAA